MSITIIFLLILSIYLYTRYIFEKNQREQVVSSEEIDESQLRLDELEVEMVRVEEENLKMKEKIKKRNLKIGILLGFTLFLLFLYFKKRKRIDEDKKKFRESQVTKSDDTSQVTKYDDILLLNVAPLKHKQKHNMETIYSKPTSSISENDLSDNVQEKIIGTEANISAALNDEFENNLNEIQEKEIGPEIRKILQKKLQELQKLQEQKAESQKLKKLQELKKLQKFKPELQKVLKKKLQVYKAESQKLKLQQLKELQKLRKKAINNYFRTKRTKNSGIKKLAPNSSYTKTQNFNTKTKTQNSNTSKTVDKTSIQSSTSSNSNPPYNSSLIPTDGIQNRELKSSTSNTQSTQKNKTRKNSNDYIDPFDRV